MQSVTLGIAGPKRARRKPVAALPAPEPAAEASAAEQVAAAVAEPVAADPVAVAPEPVQPDEPAAPADGAGAAAEGVHLPPDVGADVPEVGLRPEVVPVRDDVGHGIPAGAVDQIADVMALAAGVVFDGLPDDAKAEWRGKAVPFILAARQRVKMHA